MTTDASPNALVPAWAGRSRMNSATGTSITAQATSTMPSAQRQPSVTVSCAIAGTNTS